MGNSTDVKHKGYGVPQAAEVDDKSTDVVGVQALSKGEQLAAAGSGGGTGNDGTGVDSSGSTDNAGTNGATGGIGSTGTSTKAGGTGNAGGIGKVSDYVGLYEKLQAEKEKKQEAIHKKQRRAAIISAIGDGLSALSNLYFTTMGAPSANDGKDTLSGRARVNYDKLMQEYDSRSAKFIDGWLKARKSDDDAAHRERSWQRQLGLDAEAQRRHDESIQHRNEREQIADDRYNAEQEYKKGRDEEADRHWQATFDEDKRRSDRSHNFQVRQHKDNLAVRRETNAATRARGVRGKQLGFADGNGNQVSIYENVWKGSMQQVYDVLYADMVDAYNKDKKNNPRVPRHKTQREKEDFVKQNWHKSPKASQIMLTLSSIDPATMTSELNDDVEDYTPGGGDDEVIDYTPGNK